MYERKTDAKRVVEGAILRLTALCKRQSGAISAKVVGIRMSPVASNLPSFRALVATDLDGTLLNSQGSCSERNRATLHQLGQMGVLRVLATGRSLYSVQKVLAEDFPLDVLVFSSGAGVWDWKQKNVLHQRLIDRPTAMQISATLQKNRLGFMAHAPIPDNHRFWFHAGDEAPEEFYKRCEVLGDLAEPWQGDFPEQGATQFIVMTHTVKALEQHQLVQKMFPEFSVVRATSPWNPAITWLEIFSHGVSKGDGLKWVSTHLNLKHVPTLAVGNDYNDIEMLDWAKHSRILKNAPEVLHSKYLTAPTHDEDGFHHSIKDWLSHLSLLKLP